MGYKTLISPKGADRGKDIIASPDGLGLQDPKIVVEVKHRTASMGSPEVRSFLGGLRSGDKGLYVSTGGFSKEARYEAERANNPPYPYRPRHASPAYYPALRQLRLIYPRLDSPEKNLLAGLVFNRRLCLIINNFFW